MTRGRLEKITRAWQKRLGLERWDLKFGWDRPLDQENEVARVFRSNQYDSATIFFAADYRKWTPEFANQAVVHELLHLCHRDVDEAFGVLDADAASKARWEHAMEGFIDRTACRIVEIGGCL